MVKDPRIPPCAVFFLSLKGEISLNSQMSQPGKAPNVSDASNQVSQPVNIALMPEHRQTWRIDVLLNNSHIYALLGGTGFVKPFCMLPPNKYVNY